MLELGRLSVTPILVEGGGEVHAAFLEARIAHQVAFFYAPRILGGRDAKRAVAGAGFTSLDKAPSLTELRWRRVDADLLLTARVGNSTGKV
jgi:diaminohydroxyphosphoribosylaminopyrimidine deaminase/5-amino-6-(5-phosphoribosylamino)uracil reductase